MNYTKELLSESVNGTPIKITGLASVVTVSRAVATNVATIISATHGLVTGDFIYLSGMGDTTYNGIHEVTVTDSTTFTFPLTHADESVTADTAGTVQKITKIHGTEAGETALDEIWINATNIGTGDTQIILFYGEEEPTDYMTITTRDGKRVVIPGDVLQNSKVIYAYASIADSLNVTGYVNKQSN